ncbi:PAS domain-containing sensor histidine kinase [Oryzibacter oryziterrae]|uniref:PAS domain-containing sensor histidine kinase n=1 Tax=Oryzibacter oryziterrae TaxID=2766474 RepID=UPI001F35C3E7|nr:PAS domain-containing sensor histidine kinase [Oryzibacter oryziterrae]
MADELELFVAAASEPAFAALIGDARPVLAFDRSGTSLLWTNAAGAAYFSLRSPAEVLARRFAPDHPAVRRIASLAVSLGSGDERVERIALPRGLMPKPVVCKARRLQIGANRSVLLLVADGSGQISGDPVAAYAAFCGAARPATAVPTPIEPAPVAVLPATPVEPAPVVTLPAAPVAPVVAPLATAPAEVQPVQDLLPSGDEVLAVTAHPEDAIAFTAEPDLPVSDDVDVTYAPPIVIPAIPAAEAVEPAPQAEGLTVSSAISEMDTAAASSDLAPAAIEAPVEPIADEADLETAPVAAAPDQTETELVAPEVTLTEVTDAPVEASIAETVAALPSEGSAEAPSDVPEAVVPEAIAPEIHSPVESATEIVDAAPAFAAPEALPEDAETAQSDAVIEPVAAEIEAAPAVTTFAFPDHGRPVRFVFELDSSLAFSFVSADFATTVGPLSGDLAGTAWTDLATRYALDPRNRVAQALERRDTFTGLTVDWPVQDADMRVPIDLAGMPVFGRDRRFSGYRGFGVIKTGAAFTAPMLVATAAVPASETVEAQPEETAAEPVTAPIANLVEAAPDTVAPVAAPEIAALAAVAVAEVVAAVEPAPEPAAAEVPAVVEADVAPVDERPVAEPIETSADVAVPEGAEFVSDAAPADAPVADMESDLPLAAPVTESVAAVETVIEPLAPSAEVPPDAGETVDVAPVVIADDAPAALAALDPSPAEALPGLLPEEPAVLGDAASVAPETAPVAEDEAPVEDLAAPADVAPSIDAEAVEAAPVVAATPVEEAITLASGDGEVRLGDEPVAAADDAAVAELPPAPVEDAQPVLADEPLPPAGNDDAFAVDTAEPIVIAPIDDTAAMLGPDDSTRTISEHLDELERLITVEETLAATREQDIDWTAQTETTAEVIPVPIVPRPIPREDSGRLSKTDREAFDRIAEALSEAFEARGGRSGTPAEAPARSLLTRPNEPASQVQPEPVATPAPVAKPDAAATLDFTLIDKLPLPLAILKHGDFVHANRAFLDLAAYANLEEMNAAGGFASVFEGTALPRESTIPAIRRKDGVEVPVTARLHSIPFGASVASMLVVQETAQTTSRERLQLAEQRVEDLEGILDTATDGVLVLDQKGIVIGANRSAEALFGLERSHMVGLSFVDLLAPESHRSALDYLDGLSRNGLSSVLNDGREVIGKVVSGGLVPLFMTIGRVSLTKFCAVLRDITQWKRAEEELTSAKKAAENASSQKSDFLAKMSHEIRTPLNAIIGFSEVMMEERFGPVGSDRYKEYLRDIHMSGSHIMSLVNDLLDLSKIEAGKLELSFEAVGLNEVIRECAALMQPQANRERIIIRTSLSSSLPPVVADNRSLRQIVLNLLSNAVKFNTAGGQVIVSTLYEESGEVVLRVRDTGHGMSEGDIEKALEPFRQLQTTRTGQGTGLGLPLTKALVEANRAAFRIDSTPGQGTLVQITFPSTRVLAE